MLVKIKSIFQERSFKELFKSSSIVLISKVISVILGLITNILIARYYGAEIIGVVTLINTFIAIVTLFTVFGTSTSILKMIPQYTVQYSINNAYDLYKKIFKLLIFWGVLLSIIFYSLTDILETYIFKIEHIGFYFSMIAIFMVPIALKTYILSALRALKDIKMFAFLDFLTAFLILAGLLVFIYFGYLNIHPVYLYIIVPVIIFIFSLFIVQNKFQAKIDNKVRPSLNISTQNIILTSYPMFLISGMHLIMSNTDIIMISIYLNEREIGLYSVALKIALLTSFILNAVNSVLSPHISEYYHDNNMLKLQQSIKHASKLIFITTFPLLLLFVIFGKYILGIFGEEFITIYGVLVVLIIGQMVNSFLGPVGLVLNMTNHSKLFQKIIFQGIILNIILNIILIQFIGLYGAALATSIGIIYWNVVAYYYVKKIFNIDTLKYLYEGK